MSKSHPMSIYLIKQNMSVEDVLISHDELAGRQPLVEKNDMVLPDGYRLFVAAYSPKSPWWKTYLGIHDDLLQQSSGAILFVESAGRNFAITFGLVAQYLRDVSYEYDFGLLVTLNSVDPNSLKSADLLCPENARRERIQPARGGKLSDFGVNFDENIVKKVSGRTGGALENMCSQITGATNVRVTTGTNLFGLKDLCEELLNQYNSTQYQTTFPNLRNITHVKDPTIVADLDAKLLQALKDRDETMILSVPDIVDYSDIGGFNSRTAGCMI